MALRRLDLRGFDGDRRALSDLLPRPVDEQDRSSEAVAAIIADVRADGDAALRRLTATFDGVELDELRVPAERDQRRPGPHPARPPGGPRRRPRPDPGLPRARGARRAGRLHQRRRHRSPPAPARGPGRLLRTGWTRPLSLDRPHVRRARPRGRGAGDRPVRAARPRRAGGRRHPGRRRRGRGDRGLRRRRGPGDRRHGLRDRVHRRRRRDRRAGQPLRGRGQAPGVRRGRAWPRRSPGRPRWSSSPGPTRRASWPPSTWWSRPSTVRTASPG